MATLTFIRHAATVQNGDGIFMGRLDFPCQEEALHGAHALAGEMAAAGFTHGRTSPLARCVETMHALWPRNQARADSRLTERGLGTWSGQRKTDLRANFPHAFLPSGHLDPCFNPPDGEPLADLAARTIDFLREMSAADPAARVLVVSHNGVLRLVRCLLGGVPLGVAYASAEPHLRPFSYTVLPGSLDDAWSRITPDRP